MQARRFQIYLDSEQHETLRHLAFERRTTVSLLVRTAIEAWLKREKGKGKPKK